MSDDLHEPHLNEGENYDEAIHDASQGEEQDDHPAPAKVQPIVSKKMIIGVVVATIVIAAGASVFMGGNSKPKIQPHMPEGVVAQSGSNASSQTVTMQPIIAPTNATMSVTPASSLAFDPHMVGAPASSIQPISTVPTVTTTPSATIKSSNEITTSSQAENKQFSAQLSSIAKDMDGLKDRMSGLEAAIASKPSDYSNGMAIKKHPSSGGRSHSKHENSTEDDQSVDASTPIVHSKTHKGKHRSTAIVANAKGGSINDEHPIHDEMAFTLHGDAPGSPGMAWVSDASNVITVVTAGDVLPNGAKVTRVDTDNHVVYTSKGPIK